MLSGSAAQVLLTAPSRPHDDRTTELTPLSENRAGRRRRKASTGGSNTTERNRTFRRQLIKIRPSHRSHDGRNDRSKSSCSWHPRSASNKISCLRGPYTYMPYGRILQVCLAWILLKCYRSGLPERPHHTRSPPALAHPSVTIWKPTFTQPKPLPPPLKTGCPMSDEV
jgi:hypothetical protein